MLLDENELKERLESPNNLLNRLKAATDTASHKPTLIPSLPPKSEDIIEDIEAKITNGSIKGKAMGLMSATLDQLKTHLPAIDKPEKLARIAESMARVIDSSEQKQINQTQIQQAQIIIYAPQIVAEEKFSVVELADQ